ncbi:MAG: hypothetical protein FJY37_07305 [Betaproteobacteria bacterium]|nr:hypothetical protein [Betaproteobacteria bacterium]
MPKRFFSEPPLSDSGLTPRLTQDAEPSAAPSCGHADHLPRAHLKARSRGTLVAFLLVLDLLAGCAVAQPESSGRAQAEKALQQAAETIELARTQGALWTTSRDAQAEAVRAYEQSDFATAIRLANRAREQAQLGLAQRHYSPLRY